MHASLSLPVSADGASLERGRQLAFPGVLVAPNFRSPAAMYGFNTSFSRSPAVSRRRSLTKQHPPRAPSLDEAVQGISQRLRQERERLDLFPTHVSRYLGAGHSSYPRWEAGNPMPAAQLARLQPLGFDLQFVLTGVRAQVPHPGEVRLLLDRLAIAQHQIDAVKVQIASLL